MSKRCCIAAVSGTDPLEMTYIRKIQSFFMKECEFRDKFREFAESNGFKIIAEYVNDSPDLVLSKNGVTIGVELKSSEDNWLAKAFGQLAFTKTIRNVDNVWLVIPPSKALPKRWIKIFEKYDFKIFALDGGLRSINSKAAVNSPKTYKLSKTKINKRFLEIEERLHSLLSDYPYGLTMAELSRLSGICQETVKCHVLGVAGSMSGFCRLKDEIKIENNKIRLI
jgi:hypothetical protein